MDKPAGFNELHEQALAVMPVDEIGHPDLKPLVDAATGYQVECNGAYQILSNLAEWGFIGQRIEVITRGINKTVCGSRAYWTLKA